MEGDRAYRGGVLYAESGVGGTELGGNPSNLRWPGVKAISDRSSCDRINGRQAIPMLRSGSAWTAKKVQRTYCFAWLVLLLIICKLGPVGLG